MLCLRIVCVAQSANSADTICVSKVDLENVVIAAQQKTVLANRVTKLESDIADYVKAVNELQSTIKKQDAKDTANMAILSSYQKEISVLQSQKADYEKALKSVEKKLRRQKLKTKLTAVGGLLLAGAVYYLSIK